MKRLFFSILSLLFSIFSFAQVLPNTIGGHKIYLYKTFNFAKSDSNISFEHLGQLNGHTVHAGFLGNVMYQVEYDGSDPRQRIIHQYISIDASDSEDRAMMERCKREIIEWGGYSSKLDYFDDELTMLYSDGSKITISLEKRADTGTYFFMIDASFDKIYVWDNEPKNNLAKSFDELEREFTQLRYIGKTEYGDKYQDGYTEDGVSVYFFFKNDRVVRECIQVSSNDSFPKIWFDATKESYMEKGQLGISATIGANLLKMRFSSFTVNVSYTESAYINTTKIEYIFNSDLEN